MPEGLFGLARNTSRRSSVAASERGRQRPVGVEVDLLAARALQLGQRLVEDVARIRQPQQLPLADERPGDDRQDVVAAVAAEDPVGLDAQHLGRAAAKRLGHRVGILSQPADRLLESPRATAGEGGYGFSFVFSLMNSPSCGCSPGT